MCKLSKKIFYLIFSDFLKGIHDFFPHSIYLFSLLGQEMFPFVSIVMFVSWDIKNAFRFHFFVKRNWKSDTLMPVDEKWQRVIIFKVWSFFLKKTHFQIKNMRIKFLKEERSSFKNSIFKSSFPYNCHLCILS